MSPLKNGKSPRRKRARDFLTPRHVCHRAGIGLPALYAMLQSGQVPGVKVGNRWYVPLPAYEQWLATGENPFAEQQKSAA